MRPDPRVFVIHDLHPEDNAMLQALYSRSPASVVSHLEKVKAAGSGKFMEQYYVGYGHASIGDCGSTTIFIEDVSMLAAKAIQDWNLYSGQESSTRYIDFSKQPIDDPLQTPASAAIQARWMAFYMDAQDRVLAHLRTRYPIKDGEDPKTYDRAIKARVFDVMRSFLPAGATTNVAWHTNLRQAADKLALLSHHPDPTIRDIGTRILSKLQETYPNSYSHKVYEETERYREDMAAAYTYYDPERSPEDVTLSTTITPRSLDAYRDAIAARPPKTELPKFLLELGLLQFDFLMDFGSFRDLQRHRNGVCRMPLLSTRFGFHTWYLEELPDDVRAEAEQLIAEQVAAIQALPCPPVVRQYYVAMGFRVPCRVSYGLPATVYTIELRTGKTVHPTMRRVAQGMARRLQEALPNLVLHADLDADDWDVRRGNQTIEQKVEHGQV